MKIKTITVIDIGSTKVCCCIANVSDDGKFNIVGVGHCACFGVKSGIIVDMGLTEKCIATAVESAEKMADYRVKSVYVNISGKNVRSKIVNSSVNIGGRIIQYEDVMHLFSICEEKEENDSEEIIHSIPIIYSVDSILGIKNPIGMIADSFSGSIDLVIVSRTQIQNIFVCLSRCHLNPIGVIASGYASGLSVIDDEEDQENQIVIDFGGETTSIAFFYNGNFCGTEFIPLGGKNITRDIAQKLNISMANAERIKTLHGAAFASKEDQRDMIFVPVMEDSDVIDLQQISKSTLNQIIQPKVEEILAAVKKKITGSVFKNDFSKTVVITGGGSLLTGLRDFAAEKLNKKVKLKNMNQYGQIGEITIGPDFSVTIGMIKFALFEENSSMKKEISENRYQKLNFIKKILLWIENNL